MKSAGPHGREGPSPGCLNRPHDRPSGGTAGRRGGHEEHHTVDRGVKPDQAPPREWRYEELPEGHRAHVCSSGCSSSEPAVAGVGQRVGPDRAAAAGAAAAASRVRPPGLTSGHPVRAAHGHPGSGCRRRSAAARAWARRGCPGQDRARSTALDRGSGLGAYGGSVASVTRGSAGTSATTSTRPSSGRALCQLPSESLATGGRDSRPRRAWDASRGCRPAMVADDLPDGLCRSGPHVTGARILPVP